MAFYMKMGSKSLKASGINMNGTPLRKCGDPGEPPCPQPSQAAADSNAQASADKADKVYSDFRSNTTKNNDGSTTTTRTRDFTQSGVGESGGTGRTYQDMRNEGASEDQIKEAELFNANKSNSGTEKRSNTNVSLKPRGITTPSSTIETSGNLNIKPVKVSYTPVEMPDETPTTSDWGFSSTHKYKKAPKKKKERVNYKTAGGDCGCK